MKYETENFKTYAVDDEGERTLLANFVARIVEEIHIIDGDQVETILAIEAQQMPRQDPPPRDQQTGDILPDMLPRIEITAQQFAQMTWVLPNWGTRAILSPGGNTKEQLRTQMQLTSTPTTREVYKSMGWHDTPKGKAYMHAGGSITSSGNDDDATIQLPQELMNYDLTPDPNIPTRAAVTATLELTKIAPPDVAWPLLAAALAPVFGPIDFGVHVTGRTGTFKSELASLFQSHFGPEMDARHLPASWSSTANALEALAYHAQNAPLVVDDFVPTGTSWQVRNYHTTADKLIRAQGNQAGRARLTDTSGLQTTMYPRGLIFSTGEDTPEGHSVRARLMIIELTPGDIEPEALRIAQRNRPFYVNTTAALIQTLAGMPDGWPELNERAQQIRDDNLQIGHTRTPAMLGKLIAVIEAFLQWCVQQRYLMQPNATRLRDQAEQAIRSTAAKQTAFLENADPTEIFMATLRQILAANTAHIRTLNGGVPRNPTILGWTSEGGDSQFPTYKSHGPCIGWVDWDGGELLIDSTIGFAVIKKSAGQEISTTKQTIIKRLKDAGMVTRTNDAQQRNTVRQVAEGHQRQVIALHLSTALDQQEVAQDDDPQESATPPAPSKPSRKRK